MIKSNTFHYINVLDKAADAAWLRNDAIANNIANVDTPGYKRQDISFESELERALGRRRYLSMDAKVARLTKTELKPRTYTDHANFSYRMDGNNVDIDTENVMLAANQIRYNGIITGIQSEFTNLTTAMRSGG
ncbi:MAG: flagellar basal body rod protein FlgB [Lachnospiraceae bacterium]|nr:flagellar basal body rod protein FlgB [Butyrivibrio sp.]MBQ6903520.1 flagellar basal body rod protein FlgB [Lachnospiraceae bacterium]